MRLRLIDCHGGGRDNPHSYSVQGEQTPRCSACHDTAFTEEVDGMLLSRNRFGKLVDRKPIRTEPQKPYPNQNINLGRSVPTMIGRPR